MVNSSTLYGRKIIGNRTNLSKLQIDKDIWGFHQFRYMFLRNNKCHGGLWRRELGCF